MVYIGVLLLCRRKRLLLRVARCLQYDKVAVGDTSSVLAARALSFIAEGRGAQLSHEMVHDLLVMYAFVLLSREMQNFRGHLAVRKRNVQRNSASI